MARTTKGRDFDYVTMDDYRHDMDEQSLLSASIIAKLKRERDDYQYLLWLVVNANGGSLSFHENDVINNSPADCEIERSWFPADDKFTFTAKKKGTP